MTDKQIICAEIEKLRKEYDIDTTPIAKYQIVQAILNRLSDVIYSLQEETVSKDLEEAIKEASEKERLHKAKSGSPFFMPTDFESGFKAGAKWLKEQMMAKAVDGLVVCDNLTHGYKDIVMTIPSFLNVGDKVKVIIIKDE